MNETYREIAWKLINLRQSRELTQSALGEKVGLSKHQVSRIEKAFGDTTLENIKKLTDFFEISLSELFEKQATADLEIKMRTEYVEKASKNLGGITFSKEYLESPKIKIICVEPRSVRKLKVETGKIKEVGVLEGKISVHSGADFLELETLQFLSAKGSGYLELMNIQRMTAKILVISA
jgi:transcriptional regulator with XRE-family HTH domain